MSEDLAPSPPLPEPPQKGPEGAWITPRTYTANKWRTWLQCGDMVVQARRLERFTTIKVVGKVTTIDPNEPNRRLYEWPHGPRQAEWQLWGWDKFRNLLLLLEHDQAELGGAVASSERLGVPLVVAAWDHQDHPRYFEDVTVPLRSVRLPVFELRRQRWAIDYLTDDVIWTPAESDPGALVVTEGALEPAVMPEVADIRNTILDAMLLAIADTESRWTDRADVYLTNPEPEEGDIPVVATCPPWWERLLIHWSLGWPGRVAMWYLTFWYVPNLFWSAVIFTPFIQWGIRIHRRLKWRKINRKLFEARTQIMVAQAELSGRMGLYQLMAADLPTDEAKVHRSKLLAEQNVLALASQALGIVERNFYVRHPIYARKHSALFH